MKVALGSDHAGVPHRKAIAEHFRQQNQDFSEFGLDTGDPIDYPDIAYQVGITIAEHECEFGILICGTGTGVCIAANKIPGVLAASCLNEYCTEYARRHDHANVLCLGGREIDEATAVRLTDIFLKTDPEGGRHSRRVRKILQIEQEVLARWSRFTPTIQQ